MYTHYFGLNEKPFVIAPNPRYLYMSELHREALAHLIYGIQSGGCFILLTGDVGTGKTTVCRCLLEKLPKDTDVAIILNPKLTAIDLLKTICEELSIPVTTASPSSKSYIDAINRHLLQTHAMGRSTALVIDEAQNLDADVLEQLRLLTNLETDTQKLLKIILLGQPELRLMLASPEMSQVNQRITSRYHLKPLKPPDVRIYMQHRIRVAGGGTRRLFSDGAVHHVARLSKGIPRLINLLCDRALLGAYAENADHVSLKIMKKAGREVFGPAQSAFPSPRFILITAIALVVFGVGLPITYHYLKIPSVGSFFKQLQQLGVPGPAESKPNTGLTAKIKPPVEANDRPPLSKDEQSDKEAIPPVPVEQDVSPQDLKTDAQSVRKK
jgi:general secretion pathway protein A